MPDFGRWTSNGGDPSLNAVARTDKFLDALASGQPPYSTDPGEAELAYLLAGWRDEVRSRPDSNVVSQRDAVVALERGPASHRPSRMSLAVVGSVAAAVLFFGGFGAMLFGAGPGDPLYGLRTMMFGEQHATRDDPVVLAAQTELAEVQQLIDQGQWTQAQDKLEALTTTVRNVNDVERKQELTDQWQELSVKVQTRDPEATVPPDAPPATLPELPVTVAPVEPPVSLPELPVIVVPGEPPVSLPELPVIVVPGEPPVTLPELPEIVVPGEPTTTSTTSPSPTTTTSPSPTTTTSPSPTTTPPSSSPPVEEPPPPTSSVTPTSVPLAPAEPAIRAPATTTATTATGTITTSGADDSAGGGDETAPASSPQAQQANPEDQATVQESVQETVDVPVMTTTAVPEPEADGETSGG